MATKGKRPMRALSPDDKIEAIQRVNDGESKASVARDIGVPESTLRGWCKNENKLRYLSSRRSSPETDKSNDGEPHDKRQRNDSPAASQSPTATSLDLSSPATITHNATVPVSPPEAPIELTTKRSQPSPPVHPPRERRPDPGASVSMSAISPLSGLTHLPALTQLNASFSEIANNISMLAQLDPRLSTLSAQPTSRTLRSVRSPKPIHNGVLNLNETKRNKSIHPSDHYRHSTSKPSHHSLSQSVATQPMDEKLWYWFSTQQAIYDFTAQSTNSHQLQLRKPNDLTLLHKPVSLATPVTPQFDYDTSSWLWQYYKQIGGAMTLPDDKIKSGAQVPKDKSKADTILYSHLIKGKVEDNLNATSPGRSQTQQVEVRETVAAPEERLTEPAKNAETEANHKEPTTERPHESSKYQTKVRNVLDNLLYSSNQSTSEETKNNVDTNGEWEAGVAEALEHGNKFLQWLESSSDPSVTRMQVHQLRALLHNLRTRRAAPGAARRK